MKIPFPTGFAGAENLPETRSSLENCFLDENGNVLSRPGIEDLQDTGLVARGQFEWDGNLYQVASTSLLRITNPADGSFEIAGTILGSSDIRTAVGFVNAVIVVRGGEIYTLGKAGTTTSISSVGAGSSGSVFNHSGTNPVLGNTVTLTGFVINTAYNVSDTATTLIYDAIASTAISAVADSGANPGTASFTHAGTSPSLGQEVTLSGFAPEITYNATGNVTATTATTFEVSTIAFTSTDTGFFVGTDAFELSTVAFGTDESGGLFAIILVDISNNANFVPCDDVTHINGRFVYIPTSGDPAFFSDIGAAGTVQVLSFFDAEQLPDLNNGCFTLKNILWITGTDSFQPFRDTGASPNPFIAIQGATLDYGFIGALLEYQDTFIFIGRPKNQTPGIFAVGSGTAPKLSNARIDLLLSTYTPDELALAISGRIIWRGYDLATFTLRRDSFGFLNGEWFILDTSVNGTSTPWQAGFITEFEGEYFSTDEFKIGKFAKINTDYGNSTTKVIQTVLRQDLDRWFSLQSITVGISQGFNASLTGSVALQMSRNGVQYGPPVFIDLGTIGQYDTKLKWNPAGGLGMFQGFAGIKISTLADIDFSADTLVVEARNV